MAQGQLTPEEVVRQRNILAHMMTTTAMAADPYYIDIQPHSPTSSFAPGNLFEGATPTPSISDMNDFTMPGYDRSPSEMSMTSPSMAIGLPSSGNLFEGDFDQFANAEDQADMFGNASTQPNGPPGSFGLFDPGNPGVFSPGPLGDFTTGRANPFSDAPTPDFTPDTGLPSDFNPAAAGDLADLGAGPDGQGDEGDGGGDSGSDGASGGVG